LSRATAEAAINDSRAAVPGFGHDLRQRLDRCAKRFGRASAMVRYQNAIDASRDAELRVLARVDSLDEEFPFPELAYLICESPIHGGIRRAHAGHVDAVEHGPLLHAGTGASLVAGHALAQVLRTRAQKRLAVATRRVVHGERDHRDTRILHALQQLPAGIPGTWRIELLP